MTTALSGNLDTFENPEPGRDYTINNEGAFHEAVTNSILSGLVTAVSPRFMRLTAKFNMRERIYTSVTAEHKKRTGAAPKS